jgi:molybdopterin converting factor small subunit
MTSAQRVGIQVRFLSLFERHSGVPHAWLEVPRDPNLALREIFSRYRIPWENELERTSRIFINKQLSSRFIRERKNLSEGDVISFVPMVGGG